jgi:hypothetical protein
LSGIDLHELGVRVKRRLDEVFPDDTEPSEALRERREGLSFALARLQSIARELQWRIPLGSIEAYALELKQLQSAFADERPILVLIKLQSELCRYMTRCRRNIPPRALMILMMGFRAMQRLATDHELSAVSQRRLVGRVLNEFMAFKHSLSTSGGARKAGRQSTDDGAHRPAGGSRLDARGAYYLIPVDHLEELQGFLKGEFERLGRLLVSSHRR